MDWLNYNHLHYFHIIATEGSLKKAAEKLGMSQSTLSEQLKSLETFFNSRLFERKPTGLQLNDRGRQVLRFTNVIFGAGTRLMQMFRNNVESARQTLEIGCSTSVSHLMPMGTLAPLFERPDTYLKFRTGQFEDMVQKLLNQELDLLLSDRQPNLKFSKYLKTVLVSRPRYALVHSPKWQDIAGQIAGSQVNFPFINYTTESTIRWEIDSLFQESQYKPLLIGEADDITFMKLMTIAGLSFAFLPEELISEELEEGLLKKVEGVPSIQNRVSVLFQEVENRDYVKSAIQTLSGGSSTTEYEEPESDASPTLQ